MFLSPLFKTALCRSCSRAALSVISHPGISFARAITATNSRMYSSYSLSRKIIVTDPSFIKNRDEFEANIEHDSAEVEEEELLKEVKKDTDNNEVNEGEEGSADVIKTKRYVEFLASPLLLNSFRQKKSFEVQSSSTNELYYSIGKNAPLDQYQLLGVAGSDSGMTCVAFRDMYATKEQNQSNSSEKVVEEEVSVVDEDGFDWEEFVMFTLADPTIQYHDEDFPMLLFWTQIPEADWRIAVFGLPASKHEGEKDDGLMFDGFILRSADIAFENKEKILV